MTYDNVQKMLLMMKQGIFEEDHMKEGLSWDVVCIQPTGLFAVRDHLFQRGGVCKGLFVSVCN